MHYYTEFVGIMHKMEFVITESIAIFNMCNQLIQNS